MEWPDSIDLRVVVLGVLAHLVGVARFNDLHVGFKIAGWSDHHPYAGCLAEAQESGELICLLELTQQVWLSIDTCGSFCLKFR